MQSAPTLAVPVRQLRLKDELDLFWSHTLAAESTLADFATNAARNLPQHGTLGRQLWPIRFGPEVEAELVISSSAAPSRSALARRSSASFRRSGETRASARSSGDRLAKKEHERQRRLR